MRITSKDAVATGLVALIVVPYIGYLIADEMPLIKDPRGMVATSLILGIAAALVASRGALAPEPPRRSALVSGTVTLGLGITAVWVEGSEILLALFVVAVVVTWALGERAAHEGERVPAAHA